MLLSRHEGHLLTNPINSAWLTVKNCCIVGYQVTFIIDNNQGSVPKADLWIINYYILEMKADNEPAISLSV